MEMLPGQVPLSPMYLRHFCLEGGIVMLAHSQELCAMLWPEVLYALSHLPLARVLMRQVSSKLSFY